MLLWFLKDKRVYLHNVLFLACFNWEFFSRCKDSWHHVIEPMYKKAFVIFRHLIALPQRTWAITSIQVSDGGIWHLFIIMKSMTEFTRVVCLFPRTLDDCFFFSLSGFILNWTKKKKKKTLVRNSDLGLNQCLVVVKAHLKPAYN